MVGVSIPLFMVDPNKMIRTDGTKVTTPRHPSWKVEIYGLWVALKTDPLIFLLFPMFFASNWFYTWRMLHQFLNNFFFRTNFKSEFNDYNGAIFNIQARSLNNLVYWLAQVVGSLFMGFILDQKKFRRRMRAFSGWSLLFIMVWVVHIWAYFYQRFLWP